MNWLDILIVAAVAFGALYGLSKGLIRLVFALVGVVAGVILAGQYYRSLAEVLSFLPDPSIAHLAAYFIIFAAVGFIATAVGELLHAVLGLLLFGCFDQVLGLVLGAVVAILVVQAALLALAHYPLGSFQQALTGSTLAREMLTNAPVLLLLLPPEFSAVLKLFPSLNGSSS